MPEGDAQEGGATRSTTRRAIKRDRQDPDPDDVDLTEVDRP
ncbi:MAG: hypothetical protein U0470_13210 [Anaerolineae bacterium]